MMTKKKNGLKVWLQDKLRSALPAFLYQSLKDNTQEFEHAVKKEKGGIMGWLKVIFQSIVSYFSIKHEDEFETDGLKDFVTDADYYILHQKPLRGMLIIRIALLTVFLFFIWAAFTKVEELVKGDGKVVPSSQLQVLQSLDGGVVLNISVKEGQAVKAGDPLLEIDTTRFISSVRENQGQNVALAAKAERLNALLENRAFRTPAGASIEDKLVYAQEERYFENARYELQAQVSIAREQLSQRQQELSETQAKRDQAKQLLDSASHELALTKPLLGSGAVSEVDLLRLDRDVTRYTGERLQAISQISRIEAAIHEANRWYRKTFVN